MSDFPITVRLPLAMLDLLVPSGSTLPLAWVVLVGHSEQITTTLEGRPVYGAVSAWSPVLPVIGRTEAVTTALQMGAASLDGITPDEWLWSPFSDECSDVIELYGVFEGHDVRPEVAIAPLTALLAEPQDGGQS